MEDDNHPRESQTNQLIGEGTHHDNVQRRDAAAGRSAKHTKAVRICGLQLASRDGCVEENLQHAVPFLEAAAEAGAQLVLLPELYPTGYRMTEEFWEAAESRFASFTTDWLADHSKRLNMWIGTSFLEVDGDDFYNTFVMASPAGRIVYRMRKEHPASFESFLCTGDKRCQRVFWSDEFGDIGILISYENLYSDVFRKMIKRNGRVPDLVLMPFSAPAPPQGQPFFPAEARAEFLQLLKRKGSLVSRLLGVPSLYVNKVGEWQGRKQPFGLNIGPSCLPSEFPGRSCVCSASGEIVQQLTDTEEGFVCCEVTLDPTLKHSAESVLETLSHRGMWIDEIPSGLRWLPVIETLGKLNYRFSRRRVEKANEKLQRWLPPSGLTWLSKSILITAAALSLFLLLRPGIRGHASEWVHSMVVNWNNYQHRLD